MNEAANKNLNFAAALAAVREKGPLVQCITNYVTVNDCANIVLAAGGSPIMSHDPREVEEMVACVQALELNLGTIGDIDGMLLAGRRANELGTPVVLDPVAAGVTTLRREASRTLMKEVKFAVIRGNASEIRALALDQSAGSGVDVSAVDAVTEENLPRAVEMVRGFAQRTGSVAALSGVIDVVSDGTRTAVIRSGCATMARITGSGCMLTALTGAFCGALPEDSFLAAAAATACMGVAGELAEARRDREGAGTGSFRTYLIDAVSEMTEKQLTEGVRYELYQA